MSKLGLEDRELYAPTVPRTVTKYKKVGVGKDHEKRIRAEKPQEVKLGPILPSLWDHQDTIPVVIPNTSKPKHYKPVPSDGPQIRELDPIPFRERTLHDHVVWQFQRLAAGKSDLVAKQESRPVLGSCANSATSTVVPAWEQETNVRARIHNTPAPKVLDDQVRIMQIRTETDGFGKPITVQRSRVVTRSKAETLLKQPGYAPYL